MAKMFPHIFPTERLDETTEKQIYDLLKGLPDDYWVFYHTRLPLTDDPEIDFLVIKENYGIVNLEVKGGRWRLENGGWYRNNESDFNPVDQAVSQKHSFARFIRSSVKNCPWLSIEPALCFPHALQSVFSKQEAILPTIYGKDSLPHLHAGLEAQMQQIVDDPANSRYNREPRCSRNLIRMIRSIIAPQSTKDLQVYLDSERDELDRITDQFHAGIAGLYQNKRVAIRGSAGTGKTWMLLKSAYKYARDGKKVLITCKNMLLAEWIKSELNTKYDIHVEPFEELMKRLLGDIVDNPDNLDSEARNEYYKQLPSTFADEILTGEHELYDAIYVDEAQTFTGDHWVCIEEMLVDKLESKLSYFYDPDQKHFTEKEFKYLPDVPTKFELTINLRNTANIHEQAIKYLTDPPSILDYAVEGRPVYYVQIDSAEKKAVEQVVQKLLHQLITEYKVSRKSISLLSCHRVENNSLSKFIDTDKKLAGQRLTNSLSDNTAITSTSARRYRGLENQIVILYDFREHDFTEINYNGATRACLLLIMLVDKEVIRSKADFLDGCVEIKLPELIPID